MAALAADVACETVGNVTTLKFSANAADTYYKGSLVYTDTAGGAQVTFGAGDIFVGVSPKQQVVAAASEEVEVVIAGCVGLPIGTNIAAADEGDWLVNDGPTNTDNPGDLVSAGDITLASNDMIIGRILRVTSTKMYVWLDPAWSGCVYFTNGTPANYSGWGKELA